jgi:hypothetical protein
MGKGGAATLLVASYRPTSTNNHVDDHPFADVGAHHTSQVMTECLADKWIIADLGELFINAIPQNMIFLGEALEVLLESRCQA